MTFLLFYIYFYFNHFFSKRPENFQPPIFFFLFPLPKRGGKGGLFEEMRKTSFPLGLGRGEDI
jgi:hypothetical protein